MNCCTIWLYTLYELSKKEGRKRIDNYPKGSREIDFHEGIGNKIWIKITYSQMLSTTKRFGYTKKGIC